MAKKTIKARLETLEQKIEKDDIRIWITEKGMTTYTAPDGTKITMTEAEFNARYPNAITVTYASDSVN